MKEEHEETQLLMYMLQDRIEKATKEPKYRQDPGFQVYTPDGWFFITARENFKLSTDFQDPCLITHIRFPIENDQFLTDAIFPITVEVQGKPRTWVLFLRHKDQDLEVVTMYAFQALWSHVSTKKDAFYPVVSYRHPTSTAMFFPAELKQPLSIVPVAFIERIAPLSERKHRPECRCGNCDNQISNYIRALRDYVSLLQWFWGPSFIISGTHPTDFRVLWCHKLDRALEGIDKLFGFLLDRTMACAQYTRKFLSEVLNHFINPDNRHHDIAMVLDTFQKYPEIWYFHPYTDEEFAKLKAFHSRDNVQKLTAMRN